jgi:hypothetical protein
MLQSDGFRCCFSDGQASRSDSCLNECVKGCHLIIQFFTGIPNGDLIGSASFVIFSIRQEESFKDPAER